VLDGARVLLTGSTGRLGRCLVQELLLAGAELLLVVRASSPATARDRVRALVPMGHEPRRVRALRGDATEPGLGLAARDRARVRASVDVVLHAAASTSFSTPLDLARRSNVCATRNVLRLAERIPGLDRLGHVSTAFVAGRRTGRVLENELEHDRGFQNAYQRSKYETELLVRRYRAALPVVVFRPSIVLDRADGVAARQRSAFRFALELVRKGFLPALPGSAATPVDLVTENDAARAIVRLLEQPSPAETYHVAGGDRAPTLGSIVEPYRDVRYVDVDRFAWEVAKWRHERPRLGPLYDELGCFIYELAYPKVFDAGNAEADLGRPVVGEDPLRVLHGEGPAVVLRERVGAR